MRKRSKSRESEYLYLTSAEGIRERVAFLPIGSLEAHGGSLPLGTDSIIIQAFTLAFAQKTGGVALPVLAYGFCPNTACFDGTVSPSPATLMEYLKATCLSLCKNVSEKLIILNIHKGNDALIRLVVDDTFQSHGLCIYYVNPYTFLGSDADDEVFRGKDNSYKEASLLLASLDFLGDERASQYISSEDESATKLPQLQLLRQHGTLGFSYPNEQSHIAKRKDVDAGAGAVYMKMAEEKMAELVEAWSALGS